MLTNPIQLYTEYAGQYVIAIQVIHTDGVEVQCAAYLNAVMLRTSTAVWMIDSDET
jgi:hypothetical protein